MSSPTPTPISSTAHICILAGGSGERFWPLSRTHTPKHLLRLFSERTLLEEAVSRAGQVVPLSRIFILTSEAQIEATRSIVWFLPPENILAEPAKRDTAPAAALATALARRADPDALLALLPADALVTDTAAYARNLRDGFRAAAAHDALLTFAVPPLHPATGYGYLELADPLPSDPASEGSPLHRVSRFVEKPDLPTAQRYLDSGHHAWNAGMFVWRVSSFLSQARSLVPELATFIENFPPAPADPDTYLRDLFPKLPKTSVDYAIMEKAASVLAIRTSFGWDDVGHWNALPAHLGQDSRGNTTRGPVALHDTSDSIAYSSAGRHLALCGVRDLIVVETPDAVLVCHRDHAQDIKKLLPQLPENLR